MKPASARMKISRLLFKPKWLDKDPKIRRAAIAGDNDAELSAALPRIAREDADPGVRIAALKRLHDYEAWRERSTGDADGNVRLTARDAYLALLCSHDDRVPALARRIAELDTLSQAEIERVATQAVDRELRAAALARVSRQALLVERALKDADAGLRASVVERIDDAATLERVAEAARKTDKNVSRHARERASALRIGSGNAQAIASRAQELCVRMEALMRASGGDERASDDVEREWTRLGDNIAADIQTRYRGALGVVRKMQLQQQTQLRSAEPADSAPASGPESALPLPATAVDDIVAPNVDLITSQARFDAVLARAASEAQSEREARRGRVHEIETLAAQFAAHVDGGDVVAAQRCRSLIAPLVDAVGTLPAALAERLAGVHARHDELRRWQRWAGQQRRQAICASIEAFAATNPHPDALATRVREAREEWRKLDAFEPADAPESGISRKFNALCHRALKPAKGYFDKRDQLRRTRTDEVEGLLRNVAALPEAIDDWKAAANLRRELTTALHGLDTVDPRERTALARRIKDAIAALASRLDAHERDIETAKQRLITRAGALQTADGRGAVRQVKELQREWTALGHGRRSTDQRQWNEFRKACDAVFSGLDAARKERVAQVQVAAEAAQSVLAELVDLAGANGMPGTQARLKLRELESRWQALEQRPHELEKRQRKLVEKIETDLRNAARNERLARFHEALAQYALVRDLESGAKSDGEIAAEWDRAGTTPGDMAKALADRRARGASGLAATGSGADENQARDHLVELEFIAGIDTPEADRQRRMNYQLLRLASRMRDGAAVSVEIELARALSAWFAQKPLPESLETRFLRAAKAGVASLP